jgi:hypothetical protein
VIIYLHEIHGVLVEDVNFKPKNEKFYGVLAKDMNFEPKVMVE